MDQVFAVIWVRSRLLINTLRLKTSGWERLAAALTLLGGLLLSGLVAVAIGGILWSTSERGDSLEDMRFGLMACFWTCVFFGVLMPLLLSTGASGIDTTRLKMFPLSKGKLAFISWASAFLGPDHIFYYPALATGFVVAWILTGGLSPTEILTFALVPLIIVTWSSGLVAMVQGVLRHRRGKEIAGLVGVSLLVTFSMLPALFTQNFDHDDKAVRDEARSGVQETLGPWIQMADLTPPNLAANAIADSASGLTPYPAYALGGLLLWLVCGAVLAYALFARSLEQTGTGSNGPAQGSKASVSPNAFDLTRLLPFLPQEVVAVTSKELRYLMRSTVGRFNLLMLPVLCALLSNIFKIDTEGIVIMGISPDELSIYALLMYALLFTNNFVSNAAGWEGAGFKVYLLAPVSIERILLGKNLGVWVYSSLLYAEVMIFWIVFQGFPSWSVILSASLLFSGAIILFTTAGNFASLLFPIPRDISSMKSQPSQAAVFISLLTVLSLGGVAVFFLAVPLIFGLSVPRGIPLLVFTAGALLIYRFSLPHASKLFERKKEDVLTRLEAGN